MVTYDGEAGKTLEKLGLVPRDLALAGFAYQNNVLRGDFIECNKCQLVLNVLAIGCDSATFLHHMQLSPGCTWVKSRLRDIKKSAESPLDSVVAVIILVIGLLALYFIGHDND